MIQFRHGPRLVECFNNIGKYQGVQFGAPLLDGIKEFDEISKEFRLRILLHQNPVGEFQYIGTGHVLFEVFTDIEIALFDSSAVQVVYVSSLEEFIFTVGEGSRGQS